MTSNDIFLGGGSSSGSIINAELPNVKGGLNNTYNRSWTYAGNFGDPNYIKSEGIVEGQYGGQDCNYGGGGYNNNLKGFNIDLSRGSSIYKDNGKLIPKHYVIEFWIKYK